jgi:diguanylate cyclase (GGDEF)-like protein
MSPSSRRAVQPVSDTSDTPARRSGGEPSNDLAARLKGRARALRARLDSRDALIETIREANASRDPAKVADWIVRQAQDWFPARCVAVVAHDAAGTPNVLADVGLLPACLPSLWSAAGWVMRQGAEFLSADLARDSRGLPGASGSAIALPLTCRNRVIGALVCLDQQPSSSMPSLGSSLLLSLRVLLEPSAIALDSAMAIQKAEALSVNDHLTGLFNQRFLHSVLRRETKRALRSGSPLSALFLDLDDFKQVNDQHGHLVGSRVIKEAAALIKESSRETDVVARFGGDEFVVVLPETATEGALSVAERIRERVRAERFLASDGLSIHQTVSVGVATLDPNRHKTADALLKAADMAMYHVKATGKDGVHLSSEGS